MTELLRPEDERFAFFQWKERWNKCEGPVACASQEGHYVFLTTSMGTVIIDMDEPDSVSSFVNQMTKALELLAKTKEEYGNAQTT
jgi:hypothetical protein